MPNRLIPMAESPSFLSICRDLRANRPAPVYLLHGEEGYYIDTLARMFEELVPESDRDFDLTILYAPELDSPKQVENAAKRMSMFGRQVVTVKEVQTAGANFLNALAGYAANPNPTTVLCLCCRGKKAAGADFLKALRASGGVAFESVKLNDRTVGTVVADFIKEKGLSVEPKALNMLCEFVGTDLSRLYNEVDKLTVSLGAGAAITPEAVERNIGVSKEYNSFELISAIANRDVERTLKIYYNFRGNPKAHPVQMIAPLIFNLFANVLGAYYASDRSERGIMAELGFRSPWQLKDVKAAMQHYGPWQTIEIIDLIRRFDGASKGNGSRQDPYALFLDLLIHILNPLGQKAVQL